MLKELLLYLCLRFVFLLRHRLDKDAHAFRLRRPSKNAVPRHADAADWQELGQNPALNGLLLAANRKTFYWGTHSGTAFVMFEARSLSSHNADVGAPQTMIAFRKAANLPTVPSTLSAGGTPWERYITDRWVFLRPPLPWIARGPEAKRVLEDAYVQFRGL